MEDYLKTLSFKAIINKFLFKIRIFAEKLNGVDFSIPVNNPEDIGLDPAKVKRSTPSGNKYLRQVLRNLNICETDKIIDVGCGKGSAMKIMLAFPFSQIHGIEISEFLSNIAQSNFLQLRDTRVKIFTGDAMGFNNYRNYNYFYFYNPFPSTIMVIVLNEIVKSISLVPRKVTLIYNNPTCHNDIMDINVFSLIGQYPDEWGNKIYIYRTIDRVQSVGVITRQ